MRLEEKELRRKLNSSSEQIVMSNSRQKTQITSLEVENAQLKKHINSLYEQLDEKGVFISKVKHERDSMWQENTEMRHELLHSKIHK